MGIFDEWGHFGERKDDKRTWSEKIAGTRSNKTNKTSGGSSRLPEDVIRAAVERNTIKKTTGDFDRTNRNRLPEGWRERNAALTAQQERQSFMDGLMERISGTYDPVMPGPSGSNSNSDIMSRLTGQLDQALTARLGAIGNVRNQAQQGYDTSDKNLAGMFGATANHIANQGSQRYGEIANQHKAGLTGLRDESINRLTTDRNEAMAQRAATLQRLGIQDAAAQADPGEQTFNDAIANTTNRSATALQTAENLGANNQAFNQSVVNSVNQQGVERRAALMQQLQSIQNELSKAEAEAQQQNAQAKSQLEMQRMQAEGQSYADANKFGYQQFRDNRDLAFDLYKTMLGQEKQGQEAPQERVQGYAGLGTDLMNQGVPEAQVGQYMASLSEVLGSEYMQGVHPDEGYSRADIITRKLQEPPYNYPPYIAAMLANNQQNLGNNAYYTAK